MTVQNKFAVITKDVDSFNAFMKTFSISMYSKARQKFWIHKGATEYMRLTFEGQLPELLTGVIMLDGCADKFDLYLSACARIGAAATITESELAAEAKAADVISLMQEEPTHGRDPL